MITRLSQSRNRHQAVEIAPERPAAPFGQIVKAMVTEIPWGSLLVSSAPIVTTVAAKNTPSSPPQSYPPGPGCTAADNAGVALYHLDGLADGKTNFGVLRVSKERLEEGAGAAERIGAKIIASQMRAIANEMPRVHDSEAARKLANKLKPVAYSAWDLGARCKGSLSKEDIVKAKEAARRIHNK